MASIVINGVSARVGGGITFIRSLARFLPQCSEHHYIVIVRDREILQSKRGESLPSNLVVYTVPKWADSTVGRAVWEKIFLPIQLSLVWKPDLILSPANAAVRANDAKQIVVVQSIAPYLKESSTGKGLYQRIRYFILRQAARSAERAAAMLVPLSEQSKALLERHGFREEKLTVLPLGVPEQFFQSESNDPAQAPASPYLLCVSAIYRHKNFEVTLDALKELAEMGHSPQLVIAGPTVDETYRNELVSRARAIGVADRVTFMGAVPYNDLPGLYRQAAAYILPSTVENFPHTLVEAMASGAAIVSSRTIPTKEIAQDAALEFDPSSAQDLAQQVDRLLRDSELEAALRQRAKARARGYEWRHVAKRYVALIDQVLGSPGAARAK